MDSFVQQNSPVNNEMIRNATMNDLYSTDIDGQMQMIPTVVREKHGKAEPVVSYVSFSYDDTVDLEILNKKGRFNITAYDRRVYNAVSTLFINGRKTVSLSEIFSVMTGYTRKNPAKSQVEAIERSLEKLKSIKVYIDLTDEVTHKVIEDKQPLIDAGILKDHSDKIKKAVIEDNMLHFRKGEIVSEKGKVFKSIQIVGEPTLLTYNRAKKTLLTIPMEFIGLQGQNATDKTIAFQDYLLMRIYGYKNKKMRENMVLYDTLYRDSGQEKPELSKDFIRDRETITNGLSSDVLKCSQASEASSNLWWLRSAGFIVVYAAFVYGGVGFVYDHGEYVYYKLGVRPALKLNLESVIFESASNTFTVASENSSPSKKNDSKEEEKQHTHHYVWETIEATENSDGELRYKCDICGDNQTRVPITAYYVFNKNTSEKIRKAGQGATVKIETSRWISFHKMVMEALAERPDVTLRISFLDEEYKGNRVTVTIPAGTDTLSLVDENGFVGFLYLAGKFGTAN